MTAATRKLAEVLRSGDRIDITHRAAAAGAIDALLDAIEAGGMVQPRPAPGLPDMAGLRTVRSWHYTQLMGLRQSDGAREFHALMVGRLNYYFPEGDRL